MNRELKQHIIQACAAHGILRTQKALEILRPICLKYSTELPEGSFFKPFVAKINDDLNQYDQRIVFLRYPITKEEFLVFTTTSSKSDTHINHLSEQDLSYFRQLLIKIVVSENYGIPVIQAINLTSQNPDKPLPKSRVETLLQMWKQIGYFLESKDVLYLGPRTIIEFGSYLTDAFPDEIKKCTLCRKIVLWDPSCNECKTKFHSDCIRKYLIKSSNCPSCHKLWSTRVTAIRYSI